MTGGWSYPGGPEKRGKNWKPLQQECTQPRWSDIALAIAILVAVGAVLIGVMSVVVVR